jgi:hypothetical protein
MITTEQQRKKCAENIKLGSIYLLKLHGQEFMAAFIQRAYRDRECSYMFGTNDKGTCFWSMKSSVNVNYYPNSQRSSNFENYEFGYWWGIEELERMIIKRIK